MQWFPCSQNWAARQLAFRIKKQNDAKQYESRNKQKKIEGRRAMMGLNSTGWDDADVIVEDFPSLSKNQIKKKKKAKQKQQIPIKRNGKKNNNIFALAYSDDEE